MTDRRAKLLAELEANSKQVTVAALETVLKAYGFIEVRQKGSHATYRNEQTGQKITGPHLKPHVKEVYVKKAIAIMKEGGAAG